jgi:hypothetical protein
VAKWITASEVRRRRKDKRGEPDRKSPWVYNLNLPDGTRPLKTLPAHLTKRQAEELQAEDLEQRNKYAPKLARSKTPTIAEMAEEVIEDWWRQANDRDIQFKKTTARGYENKMRNWIVPELGNFTLLELTTPRVQQFLDYVRLNSGDQSRNESGMGNARSVYGCLASVMKYARRSDVQILAALPYPHKGLERIAQIKRIDIPEDLAADMNTMWETLGGDAPYHKGWDHPSVRPPAHGNYLNWRNMRLRYLFGGNAGLRFN